MSPAPRKSASRIAVLSEIAHDSIAGRPYRFAAAIEPKFAQMLVDGGYIEIRPEGRSSITGGPQHHVYITDAGRSLLARWEAP